MDKLSSPALERLCFFSSRSSVLASLLYVALLGIFAVRFKYYHSNVSRCCHILFDKINSFLLFGIFADRFSVSRLLDGFGGNLLGTKSGPGQHY